MPRRCNALRTGRLNSIVNVHGSTSQLASWLSNCSVYTAGTSTALLSSTNCISTDLSMWKVDRPLGGVYYSSSGAGQQLLGA